MQPPPSTTTLTSKERAERALAKTHNTSKVNKKLAARAGKKKHATAGNPIAAIDESTKEVFAELAEGGDSVSLDAIFSIPDFETALDDGLFDGDFLKALYDAPVCARTRASIWPPTVFAAAGRDGTAADAGRWRGARRLSMIRALRSVPSIQPTFAVGNDRRASMSIREEGVARVEPGAEAFATRATANDNSSRLASSCRCCLITTALSAEDASRATCSARSRRAKPRQRTSTSSMTVTALNNPSAQWRVHASCEDYSHFANET